MIFNQHNPWTALAVMAASAIVLFFAGHHVLADVYTLAPDSGATQQGVTQILQSKPVLSEPVNVNGAKGTLTVGSTRLSPVDAAQFLKPKPGLTLVAAGGESLVVDEKSSAGELRRHFIVRTSPACRTIVMSLRLPVAATTPGSADAAWPSELPKAPRTAELTMRLTSTESSLSTYKSPLHPAAAAAGYGDLLRQTVWKPLSTDSATGNAEYMNLKTGRLALVRAAPADTGSVVSIFCSRTVKPGDAP